MASLFKIHIDHAKCTNCGICIDTCDQDVYDFDIEEVLYLKDESSCVGCRDCVKACLLHALSVHESASKVEI